MYLFSFQTATSWTHADLSFAWQGPELPLSSQGLSASPDPAQPTASATAALCTSCATSAKILKQSNSSPFPPAQNRRYSGLSLDWQNIKSNCLNCTQPAAKSMTYSSDTSSAVRITRKGKKKESTTPAKNNTALHIHRNFWNSYLQRKFQAASFAVASHLPPTSATIRCFSFIIVYKWYYDEWCWQCATRMNTIQLKH